MDRIEPVRGPEDRPDGTGDTTTDSSHLTPAAAEVPVHPNRQRQRTLSRARRPSIRIQRLSSVSSLSNNGDDSNQRDQQQQQQYLSPPPPDPRRTTADDSVTSTGARDNRKHTAQPDDEDEAWRGNRRRSSSEPRPGRWSSPPPIALSRVATSMVPLTEVRTDQSPATQDPSNRASPDKLAAAAEPHPVPARPGRLRRTSQAAMSRFSRNRASTVAGPVPRVTDFNDFNDQNEENSRPDEYDPHIVNVLDVIGTCILIRTLSSQPRYLTTNAIFFLDPEVSALSTLTNVQNSLFVPDLFGFVNREPTYTLHPTQPSEEEGTTTDASEPLPEPPKFQEPRSGVNQLQHVSSISSVLDENDTRFAVLPDEGNLEGWTKAEVEELNDHVRHMLHSRRSKFKRSMKGFGQYVSKRTLFSIGTSGMLG